MAELVYITPTNGVSRVINLDHVVQIEDLPAETCRITLTDGS
jgi:hypothetical protein